MKLSIFLLAIAAHAQISVPILDQIGTSLPGTCTVGQRYTKTDATAAAVLYVCTATNTWTQQVGTGGSSIPDEGLRVSAASGAARLSTGSRRIGSTQYTLSALCDVTPTSGTGNILYWMTNTGTFSAGHNVTATVTSGSCTIAGSITAFPASTMPLGYCAVSSGTLGACVNMAQTGRDSISGSAGITVTGDAPQAISANIAELGVVVSVTGGGTATRTCTVPTGALVATCYISSLDANVTTYNLSGLVNGQRITSRICRDGTATRTMAWPSNMLGFLDPIQITSGCTIQTGTVIASNLVADNAATFVDAGATGVGNFSLAKKGSAVPTAAIPSGYIALYAGTDDAFHGKDSAGTDTTLGAGGGGSVTRASLIDKSSFQLREEFYVAASTFATNAPPYPFWHYLIQGSNTWTSVASEADHYGIGRLATAGANNDESYVWTRGASETNAVYRLDNITGWGFRYIFRLNTTTNVKFRVGLTDLDPFGSTVNNGVSLLFNTATDTNYQFETLIAGTSSKTDSGVAPNSSNWVVLDIYSDVAGTVKFQLNGGSVTSKAYTASTGLSVGIRLQALTGAVKSVDSDLLALYIPVGR